MSLIQTPSKALSAMEYEDAGYLMREEGAQI